MGTNFYRKEPEVEETGKNKDCTLNFGQLTQDCAPADKGMGTDIKKNEPRGKKSG